MNITPEERDRAIGNILSEGLTQPVTTPRFFLNMWRSLGFHVIFHGALPAILLSIIFAFGYIGLISLQSARLNLAWINHSLLFLFAPALFIWLTLSTEAIERFDGIYDLKMTCRYTIRQITALRLVCFSIIGMLFALVGSLVLFDTIGSGYFLQMLSLALASLFFCTFMIVHIMRRFNKGWYIGTLLWLFFATLPIMLFGAEWNNLLTHLPPALALGITVVTSLLFLREIKIISKEVSVYAYS